MASHTLSSVNDKWADGTVVSVFARDAFGNATGSAVTTGTVASGSVTLSGLADATNYVASQGGRSVQFRTPVASIGGGGAASAIGSVSVFSPSGGGDDSAAINTALLAGDLILTGSIPLGANPVIVPSNRVLYLLDCTLTRTGLAADSRVITNKAAADTGLAGGAIATSDANIRVVGLGKAECKVGNNAAITRSGNFWNHIGLSFVKVDGLDVSGLQVGPTQAFAACIQGVTKARFREIDLRQDTTSINQDGIDVGPGCSDITIEGITGVTGDDVFSVFAHTGATAMHPAVNATNMPTADIVDLVYRRCQVTPGVNVFRLNAGNGRTLKRVEIDGIHNLKNASGGAFIQIGESSYVTVLPTTAELTSIFVNNVRPGRQTLLNLDNTCSNIFIRGVTIDSQVPKLIGKNAAVALTHNNIVVENVVSGDPATLSSIADLVNITLGTVNGLTLRNWRINRCQRLLNNAATVTECDISDIAIGILGSTTAGSLIASTVAETGSMDDVRINSMAGAATGRYVGAALKLRLGPNCPTFDTGDVLPLATTKGSEAYATAAKQLDGGAGTTGAKWIANGTTWLKALDLGASF